MSATSRRTFLSGSAAAAAAYAAGIGSEPQAGQLLQPAANEHQDPPAQPKPGAAKACALHMLDVNCDVVLSFIRLPRFKDPALDNQPTSLVLLYGLVCVDFDDDFQEVLLPNTGTAETKKAAINPHTARFWCAQKIKDGAADGEIVITGRTLSFWNLNGKALTIEALNASGAVLATTSPNLKFRDSDLHPWTHHRHVRCIKDLVKGGMIEESDRNDSNRVASRIKVTKGTITAIPPFSTFGREVEWKVKKANGDEALHATTDAMVWQRAYASTVSLFRFRLKPLAGGEERLITVEPNTDPIKQGPPLVAVITHAMEGAMPADPTKLTDTKAFAQLLKEGDLASYPVAEANRNSPPSLAASGSDGHCECGCA